MAIQVRSYLSGPTDVVTIAAQFAKLRHGTSHVSTINVDGQSKSLTEAQLARTVGMGNPVI